MSTVPLENTIDSPSDDFIGSISGEVYFESADLFRAFDSRKILLEAKGLALRKSLDRELPIAFLKNMYVEEDFRGQGYGNNLLSWFIEEARAEGASIIILESDEYESNAFGLTAWYEGYGFEVMDTEDDLPIMILFLSA